MLGTRWAPPDPPVAKIRDQAGPSWMWGGGPRGPRGGCPAGRDSYPGFFGSLSRELPPFSFLTSFSLLRLIEARSLLKEPLRFKDPVPSCKKREQMWGCRWFSLPTPQGKAEWKHQFYGISKSFRFSKRFRKVSSQITSKKNVSICRCIWHWASVIGTKYDCTGWVHSHITVRTGLLSSVTQELSSMA